jgi:hypothetical protein
MRWMSSMTGGGGNLYKNVKEKLYAVDRNLWGSFVKDSLVNYQWKRRRN